jgi:chromate reductase
MGASVGAMGTSRAQYHLRQVFVFLNMYPLNRPEVMITNASQLFDEKGNLTDENTKAHIQKLLAALVAWTKHHEGGRRATAAGG